jgi:hypothetical protein
MAGLMIVVDFLIKVKDLVSVLICGIVVSIKFFDSEISVVAGKIRSVFFGLVSMVLSVIGSILSVVGTLVMLLLLPLLDLCKQLLTPEPLFFLVNGYASGYSALAYGNNITDLQKKFGGEVELGELTIEESQTGRLLPCGIFARWSAL